MRPYKVLNKQVYSDGEYSIVPIRDEDRYSIMNWRNEQIYHLRQSEPLTKDKQDQYFKNIVSGLFEQEKPYQLLFSFLKNEECIGYGGLVHINWIDKNAEISFIMDTQLEESGFIDLWSKYLGLIEIVAFEELLFHKIYTYAYDIRPKLYVALESANFLREAKLKDHANYLSNYVDVVIHAKFNQLLAIRKAEKRDKLITYKWANDKSVRAFSYNDKFISEEDHYRWFSGKIQSQDCYYYLLDLNSKPIGSIRFDVDKNNKSAKISYLVDPYYIGKGIGTMLLKEGAKRLAKDSPDLKTIYGYVFTENLASMRIFDKLQFQKTEVNAKEIKFEKKLK